MSSEIQVSLPSIEDVKEAHNRIKGTIIESPLVKFNYQLEQFPDLEIYLKLENLQEIGSFKLRGAGNAILQVPISELKDGVVTASAGNMAQGVAWHARKMGITCTVVVPEHAAQAKLSAIERFGAKIIKVPFSEWWEIVLTGKCPQAKGYFIHPVADKRVMAGNGTIALEIYERLPDVDAIIVPYGGGALTAGIASTIKSLKSSCKVYACEVENAAPLHASLESGKIETIDYKHSFVDGIGGKSLLPVMWPLVQSVVDGSLPVSVEDVATAVRLMVERNKTVSEGAGGAAVAAAMNGMAGKKGKVVCIISGGGIDSSKLIQILQGQVPH